MDAFVLALALEHNAQERALTQAFDVIVRRYYQEYTDATELDATTFHALETIFDLCFPAGETADGRDFEAICQKPC